MAKDNEGDLMAPQWGKKGYQEFREGAGFVRPRRRDRAQPQESTKTSPSMTGQDWWIREDIGSFGHISNPTEGTGEFTYRVGRDNKIYLKKGGTVDDWYPVGEEYDTAFVPLPDYRY